MEHRTIAEVMTPEVVRVGYGTSFKEIASLLAEHNISGVPVVGPGEEVIGVISESDLMIREACLAEAADGGRRRPWFRRWRRRAERKAARRAAAKTRARIAGELMSSPAITARPEDTLVEAARAMEQYHIERLPVVDDRKRLVGIVTRRDVLRIFLRADHEIRTEIVREVLCHTMWLPPAAVKVIVHDSVVTLEGQLERHSDAVILAGLTGLVEGVVAVVDKLTWRVDDARRRRPVEGALP